MTAAASAAAPAEVLATDGISVQFAGLSAIADVTLTVRQHEILGLIGPNGAGKTTLVNCLTGYVSPTSGRITMSGRNITGWSPNQIRRAGIARTFQSGRLFKDMSVVENVEVAAVGLGLSRRKAQEHAMSLLATLGLADQAFTTAGTLPYTDERRVGVARALAMSPAFVLLDEPAAGMSDSECDELIKFIAMVPQQFSCGVLLIEHNMRLIMRVCERIHVLDSGRTIAEGTPEEIRRDESVISAYLGAKA